MSGYERVEETFIVDGLCVGVISCSCPVGKKVLGGGYKKVSLNFELQSSYPAGDDIWQIRVKNPSNFPSGGSVYAVCAYIDETTMS